MSLRRRSKRILESQIEEKSSEKKEFEPTLKKQVGTAKETPAATQVLDNVRSSWSYQYHDDIDPTIEFFYKPHNITLLVIFILSLLYVAFYLLQDDWIFNTKVGIATAILVLIFTGILEFKDGPFIRPRKLNSLLIILHKRSCFLESCVGTGRCLSNGSSHLAISGKLIIA